MTESRTSSTHLSTNIRAYTHIQLQTYYLKTALWENEIENRKSKIDNRKSIIENRKSKVENRMKILSQSVSQISTTNLSQICFYLLYNYDTTTATIVTALYKNQESVPFLRRLYPKNDQG